MAVRMVGPTKRCTRCGVVKPRSAFSRQRTSGPQSVRPECKACQVTLRKKWEANLTAEKAAAFYARVKEIDWAAKDRARKRRHADRRERVDLACTIIGKLRERGMSYYQISAETGVSRSTLMKYGRGIEGKGPHARITETLARYYAELLNREKDERRIA